MALIKPQFELSKDMIGKKGVVTNKNYRKIAINKIRDWFEINGWLKQKSDPINGLDQPNRASRPDNQLNF